MPGLTGGMACYPHGLFLVCDLPCTMAAKQKSYHDTQEMDRGMCPTTSHPLLPQLHVCHGCCRFFSNRRPYRFVYMMASDHTYLFKRAIAAALATHAVICIRVWTCTYVHILLITYILLKMPAPLKCPLFAVSKLTCRK